MKRITQLCIVVGIAVGIWQFFWPLHPAVNPDPNHTHADFAVWIGSSQVDFTRPEYMSAPPDAHEEDEHDQTDPYFHLHDGIGHVMHRHKPDLTVGDFFRTLGMDMSTNCLRFNEAQTVCTEEGAGTWKMYVNGIETAFDPGYVFQDEDQILFTYDDGSMLIRNQLRKLTRDACLYSKTCPWRGEPPEEGCIADPEVPCIE